MFSSWMPASRFYGANVIPDPVVLSDGEFGALDTSLENMIACSAVSVQTVEYRDYHSKWVGLNVEQIKYPIFPLRDV